MGEARPGFVFSLAVPYRDTTAKRAIQVSQSPAGQRLLDRSEPATRPVVIPAVHGVLGLAAKAWSTDTSFAGVSIILRQQVRQFMSRACTNVRHLLHDILLP